MKRKPRYLFLLFAILLIATFIYLNYTGIVNAIKF